MIPKVVKWFAGLIGAIGAIIVGAWLLRSPAVPADQPVEGFIPSIPDAVRLRHEHHLRRIRQGPVDVAFFGDSILRGWEDHDKLWAEHFEPRRAGLFATTGDTTSNLLWRLEHGEAEGYQAKLCVVLIGINNRKTHTPDQTAQGIAAVVRMLRMKQPHSKILLLGLLPQGRSPEDTGRRFVSEVNDRLKTLADDETVFFADHRSALLDDDGWLSEAISPDGTHLTEFGYQRWAGVLELKLKRFD